MTSLQRHFLYTYTYFYCVVYRAKIPDPWIISVQQLFQWLGEMLGLNEEWFSSHHFQIEDLRNSNLVCPAKNGPILI